MITEEMKKDFTFRIQNVHTIVSNILPMTSNVLKFYFFVHSVNIEISPLVCQM